MLDEQVIRDELTNVLDVSDIQNMGERVVGKVRDSYLLGDKRVIVVSDRISAFDVGIGTIPFKGQVLNQMAEFWFDKTSDIAPNHVLSVPDPSVMVVAECEQLPLEFVVRGYITGVTKTSAWYNYSNGVRDFCGNQLPEGLVKDQKFDCPILTPTTKHEEHDRSISRAEAISDGLIDAETFDAAADICMKLFNRGVELAAKQGLILVDTKYELGMLDGKITVTDEVHTPDSSRYWYASSYDELFAAGKEQRKIDKEYVREWLADQGFLGDGEPPALPDEVRIEAARRYIEAFETVSGQTFVPGAGDIKKRVSTALDSAGFIQS